ncbi:hypothetical protein PFISCL1PPCAC_7406 [Pristionchus fissidentatus]|uniref:RRM domain-containing protein n=1 Tax=Pristionchus fissidentatus TaxID=1538716 RepID=A0AAV5VCF4_9BILA|nr:hypothetical protein PFISCL1PPCAC_7406 [Pristionchus fissidentatus]
MVHVLVEFPDATAAKDVTRNGYRVRSGKRATFDFIAVDTISHGPLATAYTVAGWAPSFSLSEIQMIASIFGQAKVIYNEADGSATIGYRDAFGVGAQGGACAPRHNSTTRLSILTRWILQFPFSTPLAIDPHHPRVVTRFPANFSL